MEKRKSNFNHTIYMIILALICILAALPVLPAIAKKTLVEKDFSSIDDYVEAEMEAQHIPGLALGIVQGDQIVHLHEFGLADPSGKRITSQTPFIIGSLSKSFTAMAILQLVDAGKIGLDKPVKQYLKWFRLADEESSASVTVRQLLNQTSGLAESAGLKDETSRENGDDALEARVKSFATARLNHPAGGAFEYSNANYDILGLIVQIVSGQSYDSYIQEHIFNPLDMQHSFVSEAKAMGQGLATGNRFWFGRPYPFTAPYPRASLPHGYLIASAEDMSHYLIAYLNNGQYGDKMIISQTGIDTMYLRPQQEMGDFYYGMGWFIGEKDGIPMMRHGGDTANFHANMILIPEGKWGIVLLENAENYKASEQEDKIADGVAALLIGRRPSTAEAGNFLQTIFTTILLIFSVLVIAMIISTVVLRKWQMEPSFKPRSWFGKVWRIGLPSLFFLIVGLLFLVFVPVIFERSLSLIALYIPDLGYSLIIGGFVSLIWMAIWTFRAIFIFRTPTHPM
ncbi:MAG: serine hydrolase [Anaerolineaceae bacterium]